MPFIIGYFGKNSSHYSQKIKTLAYDQGIEEALVVQQNAHLIVYAGKYTREAHQTDGVISLDNAHGLLVGKLFTKETYERINSFKQEYGKEILANPSLLSKKYWGRYAGILYNNDEQKITLVRDPLGLNTLFYMQLSDGIIFASDIALIYDCLELKPSVNWNYFADYVIGAQFAPAHTPFNGVSELHGGSGLHYALDGKLSQQLFWDISSIESKPIVNESDFEEKLLHALKECTKAWVKDSKAVCVELSGGTDSSAVMILLHEVLREDQKLIAVNYIDSKEPSSNEIEYAKEVAAVCNAQLYFPDWQGSSPLDPAESDWRPNRPTTFSLFNSVNAKLDDIAVSHGCTDVLNGQGGDHIFLAPPPEHALADYWVQKGLRGSFAVLQELSGIYRMPYSSLLWKNVKASIAYYAGKKVIQNGYRDSHAQSVVQKQTVQHHYLSNAIKKFPQGKKEHIQSLAHAVLFAERQQKTSRWIYSHPLLSQPIVELGLQIPTYQSFDQGYDRIFFRKAVSKIKKPQALWRRIKGQTTSTMISALASNADGLERLLIEGSLMKKGLIDKEWLNEKLTQIRHGKIENAWPIVNLVSAQQWLNQWGL